MPIAVIILRAICLEIALNSLCFLPATANLRTVPCAIFGQGNAQCEKPSIDGVVDGQWIEVVFHFDGTNGGPTRLTIFTIGVGGNGLKTLTYSPITPVDDGDRMGAFFSGGKLIITNAIYLPGEAHCCYTHIAARRFGFHDAMLRTERLATVPSGSSIDAINRALDATPSLAG